MGVDKLWGVGPATEKKLKALGLEYIADLRTLTRLEAEQAMGQHGHFLRELSFGRDPRPVRRRTRAKSRGAERTFDRDLTQVKEMEDVLHDLAERVSRSIMRSDVPARTLTLKVRYATFETVTRSYTSPYPLWTTDELMEISKGLLGKTEAGKRPVRLLGVSASNFVNTGHVEQLELPFEYGQSTEG
jgi:DNA polymerase IV